MLIYCDSVILMYYLDHVGPFQARAAQRLAALVRSGDRLAVSDLVRLECRVKPIKIGDRAKLAAYDALFTQPDIHLAAITTAVFDRATDIRAAHNFKLADSLHLAAAVLAGCDRFLTNDTRLASFTGIPVEALP